MRIAILSEAPTDDAAIRVLVEAILGTRIDIIPRPVRAGGWDALIRSIPPTLKAMHFRQQAEAAIIVGDSDQSVVHQPDHDLPSQPNDRCRLCQLRATVQETFRQLSPSSGPPTIRVAIAIAVPAIEAWYLCGENPDCTEAGWIMRQNQKAIASTEIRKLKLLAYEGSTMPTIPKATKHAHRVAQKIDQLEAYFPNTFGYFAKTVRSWR